ncbi:dihydrofolate reductase family protein [Paraflavitalea speifideaquila]|uniref:dihydrofolate reductase family protein n=1 Tax=Paraflavitalea speifideaquila TaxID=3076558 RepID=UPI0028E7F65F|nr:dihydrofolate reductase family protein [Paraflavitalea speifideiaquila]
MRNVLFVINLSLDGYCDHTTFNPSEELMDYFTDLMGEVGLNFFGRITYQMMFPYWDDVAANQSGTPEENRFAEKFSAIEKLVVSKTLASAGENTRIIRSNPAAALLDLKQQPGKTISVGSVSMLPELITAGLIDEFRIVVHPGIACKGRPLLQSGSLQDTLHLKLVNTIIFKSGCVAHHYLKQ